MGQHQEFRVRQIRLPEQLYQRLVRASAFEHRSVNAQITWMLDNQVADVEDAIRKRLRVKELPPLATPQDDEEEEENHRAS